MKNREKYAEEIKSYKGKRFCSEFVEPKILQSLNLVCTDQQCAHCSVLMAIWLEEEAEEDIVYWSKLPVDTKILVRDDNTDEWERRYFCKYENGTVYTFADGRSSWSSDCECDDFISWKYAKLADQEDDGCKSTQ